MLERKYGGRPDCTAQIVKVFKLDGSAQMWDAEDETGGFHAGKTCACRGFYRLRVMTYVDDVQLSILRVNAAEAL